MLIKAFISKEIGSHLATYCIWITFRTYAKKIDFEKAFSIS
jgi:hypothetical protein